MILTKGQEQGLKTCVERYRNREIYTVIAGYAGTGKTTLIQYVIAALGLSDKDVAYVAYTGKATNVLKKRGCANAMTAHQLYMTRYQKEMEHFSINRKGIYQTIN